MIFFLLQESKHLLDYATAQSAILSVVSAFVSGFFVWLFTRPKTKSETEKNQAESIQTYIATISKLQQDIETWITKVKEIRIEASKIEDANRDLKRTLEDVQEEQDEKISDLHRSFREEKDRLYESISKTLRIVKEIEAEAHKYPEYKNLQREAIRIVEMLTYIKGKLLDDSKKI